MERVNEHDEVQDLLGAYALDAVDPVEAATVEAHIAICPRCQAEMTGHREVTAMFAWGGQEAPADVWSRIAASLGDTPPELRMERLGPAVRAGSGPGRARTRRSSAWRRPISVLAAAAAVAVAVLVTQVVHLEHRVNQVQASVTQIEPAQPTMALVRAALAQPGSRHVQLASLGSASPSLDAVITSGGRGYVYDAHLTPLPAGRVYQLWGVAGGQQISYGLLGTDPSIVAFNAGPGVQALAVTDEVSEGAVSSSQPFVAAGAVRSVS